MSCIHFYLPLQWYICSKSHCFSHWCHEQDVNYGQRMLYFMGIIKEVYNTRKNISVSIPALSDSCWFGAWGELNSAVFAHRRNCLWAVNFMSLIILEQQQIGLGCWHHKNKYFKTLQRQQIGKLSITIKFISLLRGPHNQSFIIHMLAKNIICCILHGFDEEICSFLAAWCMYDIYQQAVHDFGFIKYTHYKAVLINIIIANINTVII